MLRIADLTQAGYLSINCLRTNDGSVGREFDLVANSEFVYRVTPQLLGGTEWRDIVFCVVSLQLGTVPGLPGVAPRVPFMMDSVRVCLDR